MDVSDLLWALGGLAIGLILWAIWGARASGRQRDLEAERDRLKRKLREANATIDLRDTEIRTLAAEADHARVQEAALVARVAELESGPSMLELDDDRSVEAGLDVGIHDGVDDHVEIDLDQVDRDEFSASALIDEADAAVEIEPPVDPVSTGMTVATAGAVSAAGIAAVGDAAASRRVVDRSIEADVAELDEVADQAVARAHHLTDLLSQATERIEAGDARISMLEAAIVRADERLRARDASLQTLTTELEEARAVPEADPVRIADLETQLTACRTARAEAAEVNTLLSTERDQLAETLDATERQLRVTTDELAERELASSETRRQLAAIRHRLAGIVQADDTIDLRDFSLRD